MAQATQYGAYTGYYKGNDPAGNKNTTGYQSGQSKQGAYNSNGGSYNNYGESMGTRDTTKKVNPYVPPKTDPTGGGGGGGGNANKMISAYSSTNDDIVSKIKSLLDEQKKQADEYYKTLYEQQIAQNKQAYRANQDQINLNRVRGRNYINQLYGDAISGPGISNRVRNDLNWASNSASNRQNYTNNDATALATYNSGLANNASTLAQGWYNYVLPVYTNRQQAEDDYAYRRYLATL